MWKKVGDTQRIYIYIYIRLSLGTLVGVMVIVVLKRRCYLRYWQALFLLFLDTYSLLLSFIIIFIITIFFCEIITPAFAEGFPRSHGCCPVCATGGALPCGRYLHAPLTGDKELRAKHSPTRFLKTSLKPRCCSNIYIQYLYVYQQWTNSPF